MSENLVCGKENTQHARGCGPREAEYPTCPGSWPAGSKILNMPGVLTRGKKKIGGYHARGFDPREGEEGGEEYNGQEIVGADDLVN